MENYKQLDIFYTEPKEDFMMIKKSGNNQQIPSYEEVFEYFKKFTNWKLEIVSKKEEDIRPDFYDYRKSVFCKILELKPEISIDKLHRKKDDLETDFYIMLRQFFGNEFMIKIVKGNIIICWEIPGDSW